MKSSKGLKISKIIIIATSIINLIAGICLSINSTIEQVNKDPGLLLLCVLTLGILFLALLFANVIGHMIICIIIEIAIAIVTLGIYGLVLGYKNHKAKQVPCIHS